MKKIFLLLPLFNLLNSSIVDVFECKDNICNTKQKIKQEFISVDKMSLTFKDKHDLKDLKNIYKIENISKLKEARFTGITLSKDNLEPVLNIHDFFVKNIITKSHNKYILNGDIHLHAKGIKYIHNYINEKLFLAEKKEFIDGFIRKVLKNTNISTEEEIEFLIPFISKTAFNMLDGLYSTDIKITFKEILNNEEITYDFKIRSYNNMYLDGKIIFKLPNYNYEIFKYKPDLDLIVKRIKIKGYTSFGLSNKKINKDELYLFLFDKYKYYFINKFEDIINNRKFFKNHFQERELVLSSMENTFNIFSGTHFINIDYVNTEDVLFSTLFKELLYK